MGSVARIPGHIVEGVVSEFAGIAAPFYMSAALLLLPFLLGCRVFRACTLERLLSR